MPAEGVLERAADKVSEVGMNATVETGKSCPYACLRTEGLKSIYSLMPNACL
jgi:hypothetical protein